MADIFVSYSSEDRDKVKSLVDSLEMQNWSVWWDRQITPGDGFADEIDREIQQASCVVVVWSSHSIESRWVKSEALEAMEHEILVPIKIEDVRVPVAFKQIQTVDLVGWPDPKTEDDYPKLMEAIANLVVAKPEPREVSIEIPSLAVLPFKCLSHDPEHEFLADGITEDIVISLSHIEDLFVSAHDSSFVFKGNDVDRKQAASALGVRYVLEGSVRPMGQKIRVTAQLIEVEHTNTLWAERYDQPAESFFDLQDDVVSGIVYAMGWTVRDAEEKRLEKIPQEELDARQLISKRVESPLSPEGRAEARANIELALTRAPDYALAIAQKASHLGGGTSNMLSDDIEGDRAQVLELGKRALMLSPRSAVVTAEIGNAYGLAGFYDEAIATLERAQELAPNLAFAFASLGYSYIMSGKDPEKGVELVKEGLRRDPLNPRVGGLYQWQALGEAMCGRYDEAITAIRESIRRWPLYPWAWINLAVWLVRTHQSEEARRATVQARRIHPDLSLDKIRNSTILTSGERMANRTVELLQEVWE
jgi:TolB-like protein/Flp pilus assembly protein TadD